MAGHSKWKQIKRKKAVTDQRRGALFTKLIREITIAAKQGGGDPGGNARLRTAIDAAKAENMPLDNIERAVQKGTGELEGVTYDEVTYEAYGPGGAALLIEATTDNPNRTVAEIRHVFQRHGGKLGGANSVAWMFDRKAQIAVDATRADEDAVMEAALDAGADDMVRDGDVFLITGPAGHLHHISERLKARKIAVQTAEIALIPKSTVKVDAKDAKHLLALIDALEEMDDVAKVSSNFDIDAEALAAATALQWPPPGGGPRGCCGSGGPPTPPMRRTAWPWRSRTSSGRDRAGLGSAGCEAGRSRDDPDPGRRGIRDRRAVGSDGAPAPGGRGREPRHRARGARGRLVTLRLSRRRRAAFLPTPDRRERRGAEDRDRPDVGAGGGARRSGREGPKHRAGRIGLRDTGKDGGAAGA